MDGVSNHHPSGEAPRMQLKTILNHVEPFKSFVYKKASPKRDRRSGRHSRPYVTSVHFNAVSMSLCSLSTFLPACSATNRNGQILQPEQKNTKKRCSWACMKPASVVV